jgi:hypothetical protein
VRIRNAEAKIRLRITVLDVPKIAVACVIQLRNNKPSFIQLRIDRGSTLGQLGTHTNGMWFGSGAFSKRDRS